MRGKAGEAAAGPPRADRRLAAGNASLRSLRGEVSFHVSRGAEGAGLDGERKIWVGTVRPAAAWRRVLRAAAN